MFGWLFCVKTLFQYMLLLRGATILRCGWTMRRWFQYMLLLRGATPRNPDRLPANEFQYMLLLRGATTARASCGRAPLRFNTCSSCEEQQPSPASGGAKKSFNTCSSCEEQLGEAHQAFAFNGFQYMLLLRGATLGLKWRDFVRKFQYMLLLRGATSFTTCQRGRFSVSIHAPLARSNFPLATVM